MINRINKSIVKKLWMILLILSASTVVFSQRLDSVVDKFKDHRKTLLTEKIYVHCDQRFYMIGETLWFSVYYVDGVLHKPLDVSKVAYVEVLDGSNAPVLSAKVALRNGRGHGAFYIPSTINAGNFTLRAYTHWMQNFDASFYFHQPITIVNPFIAPEAPSNVPKEIPSITFFPEGGRLVTGLKSKVGFKISDASGRGVPGEGAILNSRNDTIVNFHAEKFGMGNFEFTPTSERYHAILNGVNQTYAIPVAESQGYIMQLKDSTDGSIRICVSSKFSEDLPDFVSLFVHTRQIISWAEVKALRDGTAIFSIDKNKLPGGVTHFTVFNDEGSPVCERLFFNHPKNNLDINISSSDNEIRSRRKVTLTIDALKNSDESPTPADLSISVYKNDSFATIPSRDIFQYLWLSSDLTGDVESENYYFTTDSLVNETVDNLMLTHGWRRFKWDDILSGENEINYFPEYRSHIIRASVRHSDSVAPAMLTYLSVPGSATALYSSRSSQGGDLQYEVNNFYGSRKILLQSSAESPASILAILNPFSVRYARQNRQPFALHASHSASLLQRSVAMQTEDIFHDERHDNMQLPETDTVAFYGKADETYYLDDYTRFPVMEEVMREYVQGVFVRKRKDGFHFIVINEVKDGILENPMILLDGVPLFDADRIMEVDPLKIKKVEVMKRRFFLGPATFNGLVSFTSYKGDVAEIQFDPRTISMDYEGLQLQREFFEPQYATQKQLSSRLPDRRYLLYWNPQTRTDNEGRLQVEFYTSDIAGEYEIIVQGMTADGYSGTGRSVITVK